MYNLPADYKWPTDNKYSDDVLSLIVYTEPVHYSISVIICCYVVVITSNFEGIKPTIARLPLLENGT